jgi:hypothetical protein
MASFAAIVTVPSREGNVAGHETTASHGDEVHPDGLVASNHHAAKCSCVLCRSLSVTRKKNKKCGIAVRAGRVSETKRSRHTDRSAAANAKLKANDQDVTSASTSDKKLAIRNPRQRTSRVVGQLNHEDEKELAPIGSLRKELKTNGFENPMNVYPATAGQIPRSKKTIELARDCDVVERCVSGDTAAWSIIYAQNHDSLLAGIRTYLGHIGHDSNLVDEIAARTWYALVRDDFKLLNRYDVKFGCRLSTFLSLLAKNEARQLLRSERRRKDRERAASRPEIQRPKEDLLSVISNEEFFATLSPSERTFCLDVLLAKETVDEEAQYTNSNRWQLRHRVLKKLKHFFS